MKLKLGLSVLTLFTAQTLWAQETSTNSTASTSVSKEELKKEIAPSFSILNHNEINLSGSNLNRSKYEETKVYGLLNLDYKFGKDKSKRVSLRPYYTFKTGRDGEFERGDVMVRYRDTKMAKVFGADLDTQFRYYAPVDKANEATGRQKFAMYNIFSKNLGKGFTFTYNELDFIYGYTKHEAGKVAADLYHEFDLSYKISDAYSFVTSFYYLNTFTNTGMNPEGAYTDHRTDRMILDLIFAAQFNKNLYVDFTAEQVRSLRSGTAFSLFNEDEMGYSLNVVVSM